MDSEYLVCEEGEQGGLFAQSPAGRLGVGEDITVLCGNFVCTSVVY